MCNSTKTITEIKDKNLYAGIISPSLVSDEAMRHQRFKADSEEVYSICCWCECIAPLVSHELLEINRKNSSGFFEPQAQRGWVTTHEMGFEAAQNGLWWVLDHKLPVKWNKNLGYKSKVGGESLNNYQQQAASEMKDILKKKHGLLWRFKIYTNFIKSIKDKKLPFDIAPYDPFGVWKLFFSLNKNQKPVKSPAYFCLF